MRRGTEAAFIFGEYIRGIRLAKGLSLREVAEPVGVFHSTISNYETGVRAVKEHQLPALAKALGVKERGLRTYWMDVQRQWPAGPIQRKRIRAIQPMELEDLIQKLTSIERERVRGYVEAILEI